MSEIDEHDSVPQDEDETGEPTPLCPECLTPVDPRKYYCPKCGSDAALNPNATYMPFVRIPFEVGNMVKAFKLYPAWALLFVSVVYPLVAILALPLVFIAFKTRRSLRTPFNIVFTSTVIFLILIAIAIRLSRY
jgi:hypothetical protein